MTRRTTAGLTLTVVCRCSRDRKGDINIAHREIDHRDPSECGDVPFSDHPCRQWMDALLLDVNVLTDASATADASAPQEPGHLVDSFRYFHPLEARAFTVRPLLIAVTRPSYAQRLED